MEGDTPKNRTTLVLLVVLVFLVAATTFLFLQNRNLNAELAHRKGTTVSAFNVKTLNFMKTFIDLVLAHEGVIEVENRLKLENSVRDLNDPEILAAWNSFVSSNTESQAQQNVIKLLKILAKKSGESKP